MNTEATKGIELTHTSSSCENVSKLLVAITIVLKISDTASETMQVFCTYLYFLKIFYFFTLSKPVSFYLLLIEYIAAQFPHNDNTEKTTKIPMKVNLS